MIKQETITINTEGFADIKDLSGYIDDFLSQIGSKGLLNIFVPGSTAGVTTLEFETGCVQDLRRALEEIAPENKKYKHNKRWGDGNGFSHLRSALLGPDLSVPFADGRLQTGTWQQVVLVDCDNKERQREVLLTAYLHSNKTGDSSGI